MRMVEILFKLLKQGKIVLRINFSFERSTVRNSNSATKNLPSSSRSVWKNE